jgi:hypothetical protein
LGRVFLPLVLLGDVSILHHECPWKTRAEIAAATWPAITTVICFGEVDSLSHHCCTGTNQNVANCLMLWFLKIRRPTDWAAVLVQEPSFHALGVKDVNTVDMIRFTHRVMNLESRQANGALVTGYVVTGH